jgi:hypothetical protein
LPIAQPEEDTEELGEQTEDTPTMVDIEEELLGNGLEDEQIGDFDAPTRATLTYEEDDEDET